MQNPLQYIDSKPERCIAILGIAYDDFNELSAQAIQVHEHQQQEQEAQKVRINAKGAGCPKSLSNREGICLTIFYLRHAQTTFELLGLQFGVSKTTANDTFHYWQRIIRHILPASLLEQAKKTAMISTKF